MLVNVSEHPLADPVVENGTDQGDRNSLRHDRRVEEAGKDEVEEVGQIVLDVDDGTLVELVGLSLRQLAVVTLSFFPAALAPFENDNVVEQHNERVASQEDEDHLNVVDEVSAHVPVVSILVHKKVADR